MNQSFTRGRAALRRSLVLLAFAWLTVLLAGCAGLQPAEPPLALDTIPIAPGAKPYEGADEVPIDTLLLAGHDIYGEASITTETRLLAGALGGRSAALDFYRAQLPGQGWKLVENSGLSGSIGQTWQRGRQRLAIAYVQLADNELIVIVLGTPRA